MFFLSERIRAVLGELNNLILSDGKLLRNIKIKETNIRNIEALSEDKAEWKPFGSTCRWGGVDKHFWFKAEFQIPQCFQGKTVVCETKTGREGDWDAINPQFLVYLNEKIKQGLDVNHRSFIIADNANAGDVYSIMFHAYSGMKEGLVEFNSSIYVLNKDVQRLYYDIKVSYDAVLLLESQDKQRIDTINCLNEAINIIDLRKPLSDDFNESILAAEEYLRKKIYSKNNAQKGISAYCVGHTHIDVAWLWTLAQTREKAIRSFSTVLALMDRYPEYVFMSSQPQLYKFIKEDYPEVYEKIKEKVMAGRWEPEGAMWVEPDCNLISGESLVRQLMFGTRFFKKEFGVKNRIVWLPDTFGFSAALPQIFKKSGIECFITTKLKWNEYNIIPYDTFMWKGIDGSEILTYFTTQNGAFLGPQSITEVWKSHKQKDINNSVLVPFGYGDGGGGATYEMLENGQRLINGIAGCPEIKMGKMGDFVDSLKISISEAKRLPKWAGELYFEMHRGTYTSIARNKRYNRKSEILYQDVEFLSILGSKIANKPYPQNKINAGWETILLNQFHDILPGSAIKEVYDESRKQYLNIINSGKAMLNESMRDIAKSIKIDKKSIVVFNQLGYKRNDIVKIQMPDGWNNVAIFDPDDGICTSQTVGGSKIIFYARNIPSKGYKVFEIRELKCDPSSMGSSQKDINISAEEMDNEFFNIKLDDSGNLTSIYDKVNDREVIKPGCKGNVLQAFEDLPYANDAWDIDIYYQEKMWEVDDLESIEIVENGPLRYTLKIIRKFMDSVIMQYLHIYRYIPRIDFESKIDWKEKHILLKTAFPVDIHTNHASYDIQFGNIDRPNHWNTSWDYAKFEVCAHKWADISEYGYGVSILNDCKYGHDIKDNLMRLTLIKSAVWPNIDADREMHEFTYSLYPHKGDWRGGGTVNMAYKLNYPMHAMIVDVHSGNLPDEFSLISLDCENVIAETVKKAEDSDDIIIRVYECYNMKSKVRAVFFKKIVKISECDLMENEISICKADSNTFIFEINPYEIKTFKLKI